jgi:hypothetical protein
MRSIQGGLRDKMEDWVECLHQTKKHERLRYCTVQNPIVHPLAREKANSRNMHPDVIAQTDKINEGNRQNLVESPCGDTAKKAAQFWAVQGHTILGFHAGHHQETHLVGPIVQ